MKKTYKELTDEQKERGVIFSSTLVFGRVPNETLKESGFKCHEVKRTTNNINAVIDRLKNDSLFNNSNFTRNVIRS